MIAGDWTGELRVLDAADGKLIGKLSSNPAPLSERLAAAEKHIPELQAALDKANADAKAARVAAEKAAQDQKSAEGCPAAARAASMPCAGEVQVRRRSGPGFRAEDQQSRLGVQASIPPAR